MLAVAAVATRLRVISFGGPLRECARAVLLTPAGRVLLQKIVGRKGELWITPGGRLQSGEDPVAALRRELREETGREGLEISGPIWIRRGGYFDDGQRHEERERFYFVPTEPFDPDAAAMEAEERKIHLEFRWWSAEEIEMSRERFVPGTLARLVKGLVQAGPPPVPIDVSE